MYRMVKAKLEDLADAMNLAVAAGFTQCFREFPVYASNGLPEGEYAFLMKKPDLPNLPAPDDLANQLAEYGDVFREMMVSLGMGDRLPPKPKPATVLDLVRKDDGIEGA